MSNTATEEPKTAKKEAKEAPVAAKITLTQEELADKVRELTDIVQAQVIRLDRVEKLWGISN